MALLKERESATVAPTSVVSPDAMPKPGRLRSVGQAIARHPKITQAVVLLILISGTGVFLLYLLFRDAWSPEHDNIGVMRTIFQMETQRESTLPLEDNPQQVVTRSYQTLENSVEADGWVWINRFGSTITFGKQEQRMIASCSPYSALYLVCNLGEIP
ncbi:MAG: hypothetical protein AAFV85_10015 [Cyanobacteria bacterium J06634_6]